MMIKPVSIYKFTFLHILLIGFVSSVFAQNKVVVVPLGGNDVEVSDIASKLVIGPDTENCEWSLCFDAPQLIQCPVGRVMVAIDIPEFGGNEGSCNPTDNGVDDIRILCCDLKITVQGDGGA